MRAGAVALALCLSIAACGEAVEEVAPPAIATERRLVDATEPETIRAYAEEIGHAELTTDIHGDPLIESDAAGYRYSIFFYGCEEHSECAALMFWAGFASDDHDSGDMGDWNRSQRFGKAYIDDQDDPNVELNVSLSGGVSPKNLADVFTRWRFVLVRFAEHVDY